MLYYNLTIAAILFVLFLLVIWNIFILRVRTFNPIPDELLPFVSVLIPARNEERKIKDCLNSLLNQNYPRYEVIVLDDNSTDSTGKIIQKLKTDNQKLKVLKGSEISEGWIGKQYACFQLSEEAKGDWLLFTDADTIHREYSLRNSVILAINRKADLLSLIPNQIMKTFIEKLIIPIFHFTTLTFLPFYFLENSSNPKFTIGIGQFMLFKREAFEKIGGYGSIKNNMVDDVWIARKIKEYKLQLIIADGKDILDCRMYESFGDIWEGFSKNIYAGLGYNIFLAFIIIFLYLILFIFPFIFLIYYIALKGLYDNNVFLLSLQVIFNYLMRFSLSLKFRLNSISDILHPAGIFIIVIIALNSIRLVLFGKGPVWKGRTYSRNK